MRFMTSLRFIDVVAREGSIRKAADKLAITSTALNRRILQIEEEIGQPLGAEGEEGKHPGTRAYRDR